MYDSMSESDAAKAIEQETAAGNQLTPRSRPLPSIFRILASGIVICVALLSLIWWRGEPQALMPTPTLVATQWVAAAAPTATDRPTATPPQPTLQPTLQPTSTPTAQSIAVSPQDVPLPTVTPTLTTARIATRTLEITGQATLRMALSSEEFESSGRPLPLMLEPHTYVLGADVPVISDRWCFQAGISAVFFDLTLELTQSTGAISVDGEIQLHNGFCDSPGAQKAVSPISLEVPADATAEVVHSLQAESGLFGLGDLLQSSTGVFLELTLRNPRLR